METDEVQFNEAAFKHGVTRSDILWAMATRKYDRLMAGFDNKNLLIGFDLAGNLLEIMYNILDDEHINVFHAMKYRKSFLRLVGEKRMADSFEKRTMTEEEADALDELLTRTTPELTEIPGFFARKYGMPVQLDPETTRILTDRAEATHKSPAAIVGELVREKFAAASAW